MPLALPILIGLGIAAIYYWGHHDVPFRNPPDDSGEWLWCPVDEEWVHISEYS